MNQSSIKRNIPMYPASGIYNDSIGFDDIIQREKDNSFVNRIDKAEKIKRLSSCSRLSGNSRPPSKAERENKRKKNIIQN